MSDSSCPSTRHRLRACCSPRRNPASAPAVNTSKASTSAVYAATTPAKKQQKTLFRAQTPESDSDDDTRPPPPSARKLTAADSESDTSDVDHDSDDELAAQLMQKAVITPRTPASALKGKGKTPQRDARAFSPGPESPPATQGGASDDIATALERPPTQAAPASTAVGNSTFVTVRGDLHLYDRVTGFFMLQEKDVKAGLHRVTDGEGGHWLLVEGAAGPWVSQKIDGETSFSEVSRANLVGLSSGVLMTAFALALFVLSRKKRQWCLISVPNQSRQRTSLPCTRG